MVKSEHDLALKAMKVERVRTELHRAWVKLDEASLSAVEVERCIDGLREEVCKASSTWSELEERVSKLVEGAKVTSEKVVEEYKKLAKEVAAARNREGESDMRKSEEYDEDADVLFDYDPEEDGGQNEDMPRTAERAGVIWSVVIRTRTVRAVFTWSTASCSCVSRSPMAIT